MKFKNKFMIVLTIFLAGCLLVSVSAAADIDNNVGDKYSVALFDNLESKATITVIINDDVFHVGDSCDFKVYVFDSKFSTIKKATGTITLTIDGVTQTKTVKNGVATFSFKDLKAGKYTAKAKYSGDSTYAASTDKVNFEVSASKIKSEVNVFAAPGAMYYVGDTVNIDVEIGHKYYDDVWKSYDDATGYVYVTVNGVTHKAKVVNGFAKVNFKCTKAGKQNIYAYYTGDDKYTAAEDNEPFYVYKHAAKKDQNKNNKDLANAGNPILVLLIALGAVGVASLRRRF